MSDNWFDRLFYILYYIAWMFVVWLLYNVLIFHHFGTWSFLQSRLLVWGIALAFGFVGFISTNERDRDDFSIVANLILGYGTYTALTYFSIRKIPIIVSLAIPAALSVGYAVFVLSAKVKNRHNTATVIKKRLGQVRYVSKTLFTVGMVVIIGFAGYEPFLNTIIVNRNVSSVEEVEGQTISNNIEVLVQLDDDKWATLGKDERLEVLQTVANIEQRYLGLPDNLYVTTGHLDVDAGFYNDATKKIVIDEVFLMTASSWDSLYAVCHEAYHSYELRVVDVFKDLSTNEKKLLLFNSAAEYDDEFNHYVGTSNEETLDAYYGQACESDANEYAESSVYEYIFRIYDYLDGESDESDPDG